MKSKFKSFCILSCAVLSWTALVPSNLWSAERTKRSTTSTRTSTTTRSTSGSSVRQANVNQNVNVNRNVNVNQNVNVNRNVNVNTNTNVNRNYPTRTYQGEEVAVAAGPRGVVAVGEEGAAAANRYGAVAVGEEGAVAVGRYGNAVYRGEYYDDYEGWKVAAGVATGIAIGTMLARPPASSTTIVVTGTSYYYNDYVFYSQVYHQGQVVYQAIPAPGGAIIVTLPPGCSVKIVGGVSYHFCSNTYYMRMSSGYKVVVF